MQVLLITTLLYFCWLPGAESALSKQALEQTKGVMKNMCKKKSGVKQPMLTDCKKGEFADDRKLKCYLACCGNMMQVVKGSKINYEKAIKQIDAMVPEDMRGPFLKQLEGCKHIENNDTCELGYLVAKCAYEIDPENLLFPV